MRPTVRSLLAASLFVAGIFAAPRPSAAAVSVQISVFQTDLAPYGRWVYAGRYGRCWAPSGVVAGWEPYVDGEWVWTSYGWTWVSSDPWGDVVYHYGTWVWVDDYGWVWVPGTVWAPAWVTWAYTDDYIGWAPVPVSFVLSAGGYSGRPIVVSSTRYVFVPTTQFVGVNVASVRVPSAQTAAIFPRATKVTQFAVSGGVVHTAGPPRARIERAIGRPLAAASIDRVRTRPTTLAAGGFGRGRAAIVAPAPERARVFAAAPGEPHGAARAGQPPSGRGAERAAPRRVERGAPATSERAPAHEHAAPRRVERAPAEAPPARVEHRPSGPPSRSGGEVHRERAAAPPPAAAERQPPPPRERAAPPAAEHGRSPDRGREGQGGPPPNAGPPPQAAAPQHAPPPQKQPPPGKEKEHGPPPGEEKKKD